MRRRPSIQEIVSSLLMDEGFYEISRDNESTFMDSQIVFSDGRREVAVNILTEDSCNSKSIIHEALIETQKLQSKYDAVILALPRRYSKIIDENVLLRYGIGLIIYDMMGAEEVLPPKFAGSRKENKENIQGNVQNVSLTEAALLRSEMSRILRILEELEARLDRLEKEQRILSSKISELEKARSYMIGEQKIVNPINNSMKENRNDEGVPSYLRDNPWIDILSKRV
ncbi:MAG: hypothetical protein QXP92_01945 [Nitrososphaerota archaeon]